MRVTENTNFNVIRGSIEKSKEKMENFQLQSSTLKKLNRPSDDPIGAAKVLELRTDKVNNDQYQTNAKMAEAFLNNTDHAIADLVEVIDRAKEIAINQSSAASSSESTRLGVAQEIEQLYSHAVATANRRIGDRYLFGGYKTQTPPVNQLGQYSGDDGLMMVEIASDVFVSMNLPGSEAFNTNPKATSQKGLGGYENEAGSSLENVNVFNELQNFRIGLMTGDLSAIRSTLERFDALHGKLVAERAKIGSRIQGLNATSYAIERHNLTNAALSSAMEDADMAQVVSDLGKEEIVFRSSLATSKRLIQPTLLDFLR